MIEKRRSSGGFTLAELLIVVAIVVVLTAVSFVGVQNHQRSSTRLEFDTIAKEIFVAAQNHLTEADGQGLINALGTDALGTKGTYTNANNEADADKIDDKQEVYYVINDGQHADALDLLLPPYAVDATVLSGSYLIRYQPSTGTVLDVFYSQPSNSTYLTRDGATLDKDDYTYVNLMRDCRGDDKRSNRENYGSKKAVIGWYGGEEPIPTGERLRTATFEIHNEDTLWVEVTDAYTDATPPTGYKLKLIVTGSISGAEKYFDLTSSTRVSGAYEIVLDDITKVGMHFAELTADKPGTKGGFIPGEDIEIKVVAYNTSSLANVAMSATKTTNSLFADPKSVMKNGSDVDNKLASIANIRHLENLDAAVSELEDSDVFAVTKANQIEDLSWTDFQKAISQRTSDSVEPVEPEEVGVYGTAEGCYYPVSPDHAIEYDGQNHSVSNVKVNFADSAGMFGTLPAGSSVSNLELIDFEITSTSGNAGALVGTATNTKITNVLAHNSIDETTKQEKLTKNIEATGSAGGLVGKTVGSTTVQFSAASLIVNGTTVAGGLIGDAAGTINGCYSGGHTKNGSYEEWVSNGTDVTTDDKYDVTGGTVGGLVGTSSAAISNSYSTCSVSGTTAGGFAGSASGSITNCYATGLVSGTTKFAFVAGSLPTGSTGNYYYMSVNEVPKTGGKEGETEPMLPYNGYALTSNLSSMKPIDLNAASYNDFAGAWDSWKPASVYDAALSKYYGGRYCLRTVDELGSTLPTGYDDWDQLFVSTHYGDWPSPEVFFINTATSS